MKLGKLPNAEGYPRDYQCVFGGLNENLAAADGEICAMENMTSDHYPLLSPRTKRYRMRTLETPYGLAGRDKLCWVDGTDFYYDGVVKGTVSAGEKRFAFLNRYIVIWPDKAYYNTATDEFGSLEASVTSDAQVRFAIFASSRAPGGISSERNCLRMDGITVQGVFRPGDGVTISGCTKHPENNKTLVVREVDGTALYFYDNSFVLDTVRRYTAGPEGLAAGSYNLTIGDFPYCVTLAAALDEGDTIEIDALDHVTLTRNGVTQTPELSFGAFGEAWLTFATEELTYAEPGEVTVAREVPDLAYLCECDNRLWGVMDQEVRCSALGDPRVWNNFDGTATGCWSVEVGSAGAFTGAYSYGGYPLLFKEDHIYRVYGTKPSNFQLMDTETLGCEAGSDKSFAVVGQTLYYKSRAGFAAYAGGLPSVIDAALGAARRKDAVAGTDGRKYYVSVSDGAARSLYVYDTFLSLWHREDASDAMDMAWCGGEMILLLRDGSVWQTGRVREPVGTEEETVRSMVEFADFTGGTAARKTIAHLWFRVQTEGVLRLSVRYDDGPWQVVGHVAGGEKGLKSLHLIPRRCDRFRVRLSGEGDWKLWAISREYRSGSTWG